VEGKQEFGTGDMVGNPETAGIVGEVSMKNSLSRSVGQRGVA